MPADVAIVGMACRLPLADSLDELWGLLRGGECTVREVPRGRWQDFAPGGKEDAPIPMAALLENITDFDAKYFGISARMSSWMDPQQRLLLELTDEAVRDAGWSTSDVASEPFGVFIGSTMTDYRDRLIAARRSDNAAFTGALTVMQANQISYQFDWTGPSHVIDAACASGLAAINHAVQDISRGALETAVVGSANIMCYGFYASNAVSVGALSPDGRSIPFSASRNGYVRGEGGVVMVLKSLQAALRDGDSIHSVILAAHARHSGRSGGLTGSAPQLQTSLMKEALSLAERSPSEVGYIESHATATRAGDRAEIAALGDLIGGTHGAGPEGKLCVGSTKAVVGHLEAAAGLVGILAAALTIRNGFVPPVAQLTAETIDPGLRDAHPAVAIPLVGQSWQTSSPRLAGVNAFGIGGTLAHVVLEQAPVGHEQTLAPRPSVRPAKCASSYWFDQADAQRLFKQ